MASLPVLLLVDSSAQSAALARAIRGGTGLDVAVAHDAAEAARVIAAHPDGFFAVVTSPSLPGSADLAMVEWALGRELPCVVITASSHPQVRAQLLARGVLGYLLKDRFCGDQLVRILRRLRATRELRVLVVDDSPSFRHEIVRLLSTSGVQAASVASGTEALAAVEADPSIRLVLTDFEMPELDGVRLVSELRARRSHDELAIIGLSASRAGSLTAKFLQVGADDFLAKPFVPDELHCRVGRSLDLMVFMDALKEAKAEAERLATHDGLTDLLNRRAFFETASAQISGARRLKRPMAVAMLDVDHFKRVNDTWGHAVGDRALRAVADVCRGAVRGRDTLGRLGGEELAVLLPDTGAEAAMVTCDRLRAEIAAHAIPLDDGGVLHVTVSIGFAIVQAGDTEIGATLTRADEALYRAKRGGRNRVIEASTSPPRLSLPASST